jgi:hypothetical protein
MMQMEHNQDLAMVVLRPLASAWKIGPNDQEKGEEFFWLDFLVLNLLCVEEH